MFVRMSSVVRLNSLQLSATGTQCAQVFCQKKVMWQFCPLNQQIAFYIKILLQKPNLVLISRFFCQIMTKFLKVEGKKRAF